MNENGTMDFQFNFFVTSTSHGVSSATDLHEWYNCHCHGSCHFPVSHALHDSMDLARKPGRSERIQLYHVAVVLEYIDLDTTLPPTPQLRRASLIVRVWEALVFKFGGF